MRGLLIQLLFISWGLAQVPVPLNFFTDSVQPVFDMNCTGCHANQGPGWWPTGAENGGLDLSPDSSYKYLVNYISIGDTRTPKSLRVSPRYPENSSLYNKIIADFDNVWYGTPMPAGFALINSDSAGVDVIKRWIAAGAPPDIVTHIAAPSKVTINLPAPTTPDPATTPNFYQTYIQPIWDVHCAGCHMKDGAGWLATGGAVGGLDLTDGASYASLVYQTSIGDPSPIKSFRVNPGNSDESSLYNKVVAEFSQIWYGTAMPAGFALVNTDSGAVATIKQWIDAGAATPINQKRKSYNVLNLKLLKNGKTLFINSKKEFEYFDVINFQGQRETRTSNRTINISNWNSGLYIILGVQKDGTRLTGKFILN